MYLKAQSIQTLQRLEWRNQVNSLRNKLISNFKISNEFFIEVQKDIVNGVLFSLFGNIDCLSEEEFKEFYLKNDRISNNTKGKLHRVFEKTVSINMLKEQDEGQFIKQMRDNFHIISLHKQLIESCNQAWDLIAPKALPRKYPYIYFKLSSYQVCKLKQDKRKVVIIEFKNEKSSLLCMIQTQEYFSVNEMNKIVDQINLQKSLGDNNKENKENSCKIKEQVNNPQIKNKLKNQPNTQNNDKKSVQIIQPSQTSTIKSSQNDLTSQQIRIQQVQKQLEEQKQQQIKRSNLYTTLFFIIFIVFGVFLLSLYEQENLFTSPIIQSQSQLVQKQQKYLDYIVYFPNKIIRNTYFQNHQNLL